jgi:two-component sensor histidine kinase
VRWDLPHEHAQAGLELEWIETGGPPCRIPSQPGYGTRAIRSLIPYELEGTVDLAFAADGVRCKIELPPKCIGKDAWPADAARELNAAGLSGARLSAAPSP